MAFLDHVRLSIKAGNGGSGVVRWRREKAIAMGGPAGGDGGRGGNVYVVGKRNLHTLSNFAQQKEFQAEHGSDGGSKNQHGKQGDDLYLYFPLGTTLYIEEYEKTIELLVEGQTELLFHGGMGGLGNTNFKSSTNRSPEEFTAGKPGEFGTVIVDLKMIADVGLIGYPNAGKSSLLNSITNAQSKVGNYNFTTLEPHLGDWFGFILADIPGLIEGASEGRGLGTQFLKHIERTGILVHLIESTSKDYLKDYKTIKNELKQFNSELLNKKEIVIISKIDNLGVDINGKLAKTKSIKFKMPTKAKLAKMTKDEKLILKLEEKESKLKEKIKKDNLKKQEQTLKTFKANISKLEKAIKQKVLTLSLYDDKSVKEFEKVLKKNLK